MVGSALRLAPWYRSLLGISHLPGPHSLCSVDLAHSLGNPLSKWQVGFEFNFHTGAMADGTKTFTCVFARRWILVPLWVAQQAPHRTRNNETIKPALGYPRPISARASWPACGLCMTLHTVGHVLAAGRQQQRAGIKHGRSVACAVRPRVGVDHQADDRTRAWKGRSTRRRAAGGLGGRGW